MRRRRMRREDVEDLFAVLDAAARLDLLAEHDLLAGIVERGNKAERAAAIDGPSGKCARDLDDVLLRVAGIDTECVEFQQLSTVVFIQPAHTLFALRRIASLIRLWPRHDRHTASKPSEWPPPKRVRATLRPHLLDVF